MPVDDEGRFIKSKTKRYNQNLSNSCKYLTIVL